MSSPEFDFAVLIPARNEEATIGRIVDECNRYCRKILVIDDGSSDKTGIEASHAGASVVKNLKPAGLGAALELGIEHLKKDGVAVIVTLDGDGAHDPAFIPSLLHHHASNEADLTLGSRFLNEPLAIDVPSPKRAANFFATSLVAAITGTDLTDVISGMRVLGPKVLNLKPKRTDYGFSQALVVQAIQNGLSISESPIAVRYDADNLFCTGKQELFENISFSIQISDNVDIRRQLFMLRTHVERLSRVSISIAGRLVVLHPIPEHNGFIFQFQSPWYAQLQEEADISPLIRF
ncbi:MAG TPA: glycosyltransferase family 2 protein [Thermoanaerobaculia bacterium]